MKTTTTNRPHRRGLRLLLCAVLPLAAAACTTSQPQANCTVAQPGSHGHAAKYTLKPGQAVTGACVNKKGEEIAFHKYLAKVDSPNGGKQDPNKPSIALRTTTLGKLNVQFGAAEPTTVNSLGDFPVLPDAEDFCTAPGLTKAEQTKFTTFADGGIDSSGPTDTIAYEWSNVRVLNRPDALGTQVAADLKYTEGGCTAEYAVRAVWPAVSCKAAAGGPDQNKCSPTPVPDAGLVTGSGINPDFPVTCDPDILLCVLASDVPAFK